MLEKAVQAERGMQEKEQKRPGKAREAEADKEAKLRITLVNSA